MAKKFEQLGNFKVKLLQLQLQDLNKINSIQWADIKTQCRN